MMNQRRKSRARFLACTAICSAAILATPARAQDTAESEYGLSDIIVTAQKREQSLQDVPIAVTAIAGDALAANRVTNVIDLSSLAPGIVVRPSIGSSSLPSFVTRGAVSYGVVPGSDKQVSIYLDGVYLSSPRGSIFDLPDVERIEMLRGPQGTLFGRNATAGAVSVSTRDPSGEAHILASGSLGNRDLKRFQLSADTPQMGSFSGYFSFVRNEYRGSVRNTRSDTFDRATNALTHPRIAKSAKWLGGKQSDSIFAAVKFEPTERFKAVYKFDRNDASETPGAVGLFDWTRTGFTGTLLTAVISSQPVPVPIASNRRRPATAANSYSVPTDQFQEGHNLTVQYELSDRLTLKNIAAFRSSKIQSQASISGIDALVFTPQADAAHPAYGAEFVGAPFVTLGAAVESRSKQWSNELQINYESDLLTLTVGGLYFKSKDRLNEAGFATNVALRPLLGGILPSSPGIAYNKAESSAGYAQGEVHVTSQLDLVLGGRVTRDDKYSRFQYGNPANFTTIEADYKDTRFSYLVGVNFKPSDDTLLYAKWSTAYVSGGTVGPVAFDPETARSAEAGIKADLLDRRLRTNLSVFWAEYKNYQTTQGAATLGPIVDQITGSSALSAVLGTFVFPQGTVKAKGFELEVTAAPVEGVVLGGSLGYTDTSFSDVPAFLKVANNLAATAPDSAFRPALRPKWTASAYAQYTSGPLIDEAYLTARVQGNFQSSMIAHSNANIGNIIPAYTETIPSYWLVNARAALKDISLAGLKAEIALWGKNLFDEDRISFPLNSLGLGSGTFIEARSYGVDMTIEF